MSSVLEDSGILSTQNLWNTY